MGDLRIFLGDSERAFVAGEVVRIGRDVSSTVLVENPNVSRHHASIANENGVWVLRDVGSSQGTFHDGRRIDSLEIRGTVQVTLGREDRGETLVFEAAIEPASQARPGGAIAEVDLHAATEMVGSKGPVGGDPTTAGTVIEPEPDRQRPAAQIDDAEVAPGTVVTGQEIRLECAGRSYQFLPHQQIRIGRDSECEIVIANPTVSRVHAVIYHDGQGWILTDPGSTTGVFRDGGRITSALVVGSSAVWLGSQKDGERVVMATSMSPSKSKAGRQRQRDEGSNGGSPGGQSDESKGSVITDTNKLVLTTAVITAAVLVILLIVVAIGAYLFLARN